MNETKEHVDMLAPDLYRPRSSCTSAPLAESEHQPRVAAKKKTLNEFRLWLFVTLPHIVIFSYIWDPAQRCVVVQEGTAFTVRVKLNVPQMENTRNYSKQVLHRQKKMFQTWCKTCRVPVSNSIQLTLVLISSMLMICSAFFTVFHSFLSLMEDTMAHSPCQRE